LERNRSQLLSGTDVDDGWTPLHRVHSAVWNHVGGIFQADGEGFSDEDGFTILWQFAETTSTLTTGSEVNKTELIARASKPGFAESNKHDP
jgi:hypothetical protein